MVTQAVVIGILSLLVAWDAQAPRTILPQPVAPPSEVVPAAPEHDFGTVAQGASVVHAFIIRNRGARGQTIERVDLSASGMTARFARIIEPGGEGTVTVRWETSTISGDVTADAVVRFTDPAAAPITLVLKGRVRAPVEIVPYPAVFFSVFKGESAERRVRIVNNDEGALTISRVEPLGQHFAADVAAVNPGRVYVLSVKVSPNVPPGRYMESVVLHTNHPKRPRLEIAVNLLVKADLYADPEEVDFGLVSLAQLQRSPQLALLLTHPVIVRKRSGTFGIKSIEASLPELVITRQPDSGSSQVFRLDVGLDMGKLRPGPMTGSVRILTTDQEYPELIVGVSGEVK